MEGLVEDLDVAEAHALLLTLLLRKHLRADAVGVTLQYDSLNVLLAELVQLFDVGDFVGAL